jgi:signal transduction histidine kinase
VTGLGAFGRLGAFGLRGRIVGAVLVTAVAALAVAAVALLGPLENSLRSADLQTLRHELTGTQGATIASLRADQPWIAMKPPSLQGRDVDLSAPPAPRTPSQRAYFQILGEESRVGQPIGASEVALLGYPEPSGAHATPIAVWPIEAAQSGADPFDDAASAFRSHRRRYSVGSIDGVQYARAAIPITTTVRFRDGSTVAQRWVLLVRKPLDEVSSAVSAVRTAFFVAALVALALTLIIGIPLSGRIVRRLQRLRQAALQLARGGPAVDVPVDRARDEVGDLARTFALMQRQLRQQEEARRAFVATASHELRTPLATLDGMLELLDEDLQSGAPDLDDAQSLLVRARAQSRRLGRLAADLLDLSRLDAEVQLRSEPVELGELSRAVLAEFELSAAERGVSTVLDDHAGAVWALGDPGSVARIVRILLDNAVRLSPSGSELTVELRNGSAASVTVADQGPGVSPDERELIFERFKRGRETAGSAGFGLGLAIGRELAARMGGELVLEDDGSGAGAKFTLRLPVAHAPDEEPVAVA